MKKTTLSLCMIVKDEEKNLSTCLDSVKDIVDQIIVLDTGSQDSTIEIAKRFGAEVYQFPWCDDFSVARNESIKYAKCDWILWMDADEVLDLKSIPILKEKIKTSDKNKYYSVRISSRNETQNKITYSEAHRLFPNGLGIHFKNRIHEQIFYSAQDKGLMEELLNIHIIHEGYNLTDKGYKNKLLRNHPLLEKMVDENKEFAYAHYTLAHNYSGLKKYRKAIVHFEKAIQLGGIGAKLEIDAMNVLSQSFSYLGEWKSAEDYAKKSIEQNPLQSGAYYMLYKCAEEKNDYNSAEKYLVHLLEIEERFNKEPQKARNDLSISRQKVKKTLGFNYIKQGKNIKALNQFMDLDCNELSKSLVSKLIQLVSRPDELTLLIKIIEKYLKYEKEIDIGLYDILGQSYIKLNKTDEALDLYLMLYNQNRREKLVIRRLGALYAKKGELEKAENLIIELNQIK